MQKAEKPYLKEWNYIGIHAVNPIAGTEWDNPDHGHIVGFNQKAGQIKPVTKIGREHMYALSASHEIILVSDMWHWCFRETGERNKDRHKCIDGKFVTIHKSVIDGVDFANPNQEVGMVIWGRRKLLGRNPGATFIYHEDHLYHILSWKDIVGKNSKESRMCKTRDKRLVLFAQQRTDEETKSIIELFQKERPKQSRH